MSAKTTIGKWAIWTPTITSVYLDGEHVATYEDWDKGGHYATMEISVAGKTEQDDLIHDAEDSKWEAIPGKP